MAHGWSHVVYVRIINALSWFLFNGYTCNSKHSEAVVLCG